ncbi:pimeloyl-ACP methyl ester carboxylesterase [Diaminobutyricimonas aerilata]|uniref:Pimeloyl-ACP methyl ester carboxylesterase n=1 Tax=Diaminobutyricimonas aerilata TaxID=1162967 RepID=A0A2M9CL06_9MICO|nr:alpha/beta hydrolase [Diaminobutyricimonas aerilata]PJJ72549.1 pimeloyl-ACP methyl ester carboxylesterase [Diaminobutyricimonas aerilata]
MTLPDGRSLAWSEWGAPTARPVLFCSGAGMSGSLGFGLDDLDELGLRLVGIDRPGFGRSSGHPELTLDSWVADVRALPAVRDGERPLAVGFSQGSPFALALGASGVVDAVAVVAGLDDVQEARERLVPQVAGMVEEATADPAGFERRFAEMADADGLWSLVLGMSGDADRAFYAGALAEGYRRSLEEGFARGAAGYARELAVTYAPWPFRVEDVHVPVQLWYGLLDTSPVHSPDFGQTLERRLPRARRFAIEDAGSSLLWTRARDILSTLDASAPR